MPVRILHCHSTFSLGGKEARAVRLMNAWGGRATHTILSAMPGRLGAREAIAPGIAADFPSDAPPLAGRPGLARYRELAKYMRGFDLVLTYNWGAMDAVMARRLYGGPPLIHHEDGFNDDEAVRQKRRRVLFRRLALPAARRLVVPSRTLERIAGEEWRQPQDRIVRIGNGIDLDALDPLSPPRPAWLRREPCELLVVTVAGLRKVKNLPLLVEAVAALNAATRARLYVLGEGPVRGTIEQRARELGVADRVHLPGFVPAPGRVLPLFDIFALSSLSEQSPISLAEAMAAGLPAVATDVGDVAALVAPANRPFVVPPEQLAGALIALADDPSVREAIGAANRAKALAEFGAEQMIAAYAELYGEAIGRADAFRA